MSSLAPIGWQRPTPTLWRRLKDRLRPPRSLKVTASGRTYLVVTLGIGLGALNTGNNLLYLVLGLLLSLIVVSGVLSERCLKGLEVRRLGAEGAFAQDPFPFRWAVRRDKGHAFALEFTEDNPALQGTGRLAHLPPGQEVVVRADLVTEQRGPHLLRELRVTTRYPFGLFAKTRAFAAEGMLLVYPRRVLAPSAEELPEEGDDGAQGRVRQAGGTGDVMGLVALRDGEDARHIHWRRSAALGQLVRLEREREERRTFILQNDEGAPPPKLERACERLAAQAHALLQQGHEVGLHSGEVKLRPSGGPAQHKRILRALAWAGFDREAAP